MRTSCTGCWKLALPDRGRRIDTVIVRQGFLAGELPAGVAYFRARYRPNRADNPIAFHFFLALYFCGGVALVVWGILALFGGRRRSVQVRQRK